MKIERDFPYLVRDWDRHDNCRLYVRYDGRKIRIRHHIESPEFDAAYKDALATLAVDTDAKARRVSGAPHGSFGWLAAQYFASAEFLKLDLRSQVTRRSIIEACLAEPITPDSPHLMRSCPVSKMRPAHIQMLRDRKIKTGLNGAANNRLKYLGTMFSWAVEHGKVRNNPVRDVRKVKYASDGFYTWTEADVAKYEAKHPVGSKARLAMALLLYLGARSEDAVVLGRQHDDGTVIRYVPQKTDYVRAEPSVKPVLPVLREIIDAAPTGNMTFLTTEYGRAFTVKGFYVRFKKWCRQAELPDECSPHGLKKAGAVRCAEAGASTYQMMAIFDWASANQAQRYIEQASRKKMAADAMHMLAVPAAKAGT